MTITKTWHHTVNCMDCKAEIVWATDEPDLDTSTYEGDDGQEYPYQQFRCINCVKKVDPWNRSVHLCLRCNAHFDSLSLYQLGCGDECEDWLDAAAERAQDRDLEREQAWLESYGEEEGA